MVILQFKCNFISDTNDTFGWEDNLLKDRISKIQIERKAQNERKKRH